MLNSSGEQSVLTQGSHYPKKIKNTFRKRIKSEFESVPLEYCYTDLSHTVYQSTMRFIPLLQFDYIGSISIGISLQISATQK